MPGDIKISGHHSTGLHTHQRALRLAPRLGFYETAAHSVHSRNPENY